MGYIGIAKKMAWKFLTVLFSVLTLVANGQEVQTVIPYEMVGGKMIVKMYLNGRPERFIFDTGAGKSSLTAEYCVGHGMPLLDSMKVVDVNNHAIYYKQTTIDTLTSGDGKLSFVDFCPVIMEDTVFMKCFDAVGLIGSDMLFNLICEIDAKKKNILLTTGEKPSNESLRCVHLFKSKLNLPVFEIVVSGIPIQVMFDSGYEGFLKLRDSDYRHLKEASAITDLEIGYGDWAIGMSGKVKSTETVRVQMADLRLGPARFANVIAETADSPVSLFGMRALDFGKVVIDYPRQRFYYIPFALEPVSPKFKLMPYNLTVSDGKLTVATVWGDMKELISKGDEVTRINGKLTGNYDFCSSIINGIDELQVEGPIVLTIRTQNGETIELEYKNEIKKNSRW